MSEQLSEGEIDILVLSKLKERKWNIGENMTYQHSYAPGRIFPQEDYKYGRENIFSPEFVLSYKPEGKNMQPKVLAIVEDKIASDRQLGIGAEQVKDYASLLGAKFAYVSNGTSIVEYNLVTGKETKPYPLEIPTPEELWEKCQKHSPIPEKNFPIVFQPYNRILKNSDLSIKLPRYYQEAAINAATEAIAKGDKQILITMATGTGKTFVASQIAWKLWKPAKTKPRILYLVDRTFLLDQAKDDYFTKIFGRAVSDIKDKITKDVVKSRDIYFSLYQGINDRKDVDGLYKKYKPDFFDYVIIDECHRGGSTDDGNWRAILDYFSPATHIGMTATPKSNDTANTYRYFKKPVYTYSLKQGIEDGFLSPYSVIRVIPDIDEKGWKPTLGQKGIHGEDIQNKEYRAPEYDKKITLNPRIEFVAKHIVDYLRKTNIYDKTLIFCQDQQHALDMAHAINNIAPVKHPKYCVRIVSDERANIKTELKENFAAPDSKYPVIVTTSKLLSTGIDIPTLKNVVIDKKIRDVDDFKQTIGRGTRLNLSEKPFQNKYWFTILDYRGSSELFFDSKFDGEPYNWEIEKWEKGVRKVTKKKSKLKKKTEDVTKGIKQKDRPVVDGFEVDLASRVFYKLDADGNHLKMFKFEEYTKEKIRELYPDEMELYKLLQEPEKRKVFKEKLQKLQINLQEFQILTDNTDKDAFELLISLAYGGKPISRSEKISKIKKKQPFKKYKEIARKVLEVILDLYADVGFRELENPKQLLQLPQIKKIASPIEIIKEFGGVEEYQIAVDSLSQIIYER
jgi:type I restriction enzyme, R subunit